ncbi:MAG: rhodanese-like domain-containing protein [Acidobacteria bacterium]|nr:rhodanese-like domain-containing protein [Acidobacteriota bacterium]
MKLNRLSVLVLLGAIIALLPLRSVAQQEHVPASSIPQASLIQPADLSAALQSSAPKPLILHVGSVLMFATAHIPGSEYVGPGGKQIGVDALKRRVASLPKDTAIVLYCGCCPWGRCPNIAPAYNLLHDAGFTNLKVLYLADNFGTDWVDKGYPVTKGN